jgi:hypothetical protein
LFIFDFRHQIIATLRKNEHEIDKKKAIFGRGLIIISHGIVRPIHSYILSRFEPGGVLLGQWLLLLSWLDNGVLTDATHGGCTTEAVTPPAFYLCFFIFISFLSSHFLLSAV